MDAVIVARASAVVLAAGAITLAWFGEAAPAVVLASSAVALPLVTLRPVQRRNIPTALAGLAELVEALHLQGNGIQLPDGRHFIPADPKRVDVDGEETIHRSGAIGVSITPLGSEMDRQWTALGDKRRAGTEGASVSIRRGLEGLGLADDVHVDARTGGLRVRYRPRTPDACRESREVLGIHARIGCPTCSFAAILAARNLDAPVRLASVAEDAGTTILELEVLASTQPAD